MELRKVHRKSLKTNIRGIRARVPGVPRMTYQTRANNHVPSVRMRQYRLTSRCRSTDIPPPETPHSDTVPLLWHWLRIDGVLRTVAVRRSLRFDELYLLEGDG